MTPTPPPGIVAFAHGLDAFGRRWNDYEIVGGHHVPTSGPALLVLYHGFVPLDGWYLAARYYLQRGRMIRSLADRFLFKTPGLSWVVKNGGAIPGERQPAVQMLRAGEIVIVSPGGVREALAPHSRHYLLMWGERTGFAHVALEADVPVLPVFTRNVEELYRSPGSGSRPVQAIYEATRWPVTPIVGLGLMPFPVKLTTYIGEPIQPVHGETAESLRDRTRAALQALIGAHQPGRPRLLRGLVERVRH